MKNWIELAERSANGDFSPLALPCHEVSLPTTVKAAPSAHRFAAAALTAVAREEITTTGTR